MDQDPYLASTTVTNQDKLEGRRSLSLSISHVDKARRG